MTSHEIYREAVGKKTENAESSIQKDIKEELKQAIPADIIARWSALPQSRDFLKLIIQDRDSSLIQAMSLARLGLDVHNSIIRAFLVKAATLTDIINPINQVTNYGSNTSAGLGNNSISAGPNTIKSSDGSIIVEQPAA